MNATETAAYLRTCPAEKLHWHEHEFFGCVLKDQDGEVLGSLWGIDFGPNDAPGRGYCRVVEAELASEALWEIRKSERVLWTQYDQAIERMVS